MSLLFLTWIVKWLGAQRVNPIAVGDKAGKERVVADVQKFAQGRGRGNGHPIMIVSYETLRAHAGLLAKTTIGLLLCDEGHRLKNSQSQTYVALNELKVQRRVILSGTPVQNDLSEYFSLLNFTNPDLLGSPSEFRRNFETPILRGRDADCTDAESKASDEKLQELTALASKFIIRRTNDILSKYLPVKYEHVVFCKLGTIQTELYKLFVKSKAVRKLIAEEENGGAVAEGGGGLQPLKAITMLKKLCNDIRLLDLPEQLPGSDKIVPAEWKRDPSFKLAEGKMTVLERLLTRIKAEKEKVVLISNYTQTLDLFERLCRARRFAFLRLDGTMSVTKRQQLVDKFNDLDGGEFIFLLSSKAGGCGLNLIGANRLVLFDPDWNPAADQQALARVWRDGQGKVCYIYRLIGTGTIEEKIFQRQTHKLSLSSCVVDAVEDVERHFSMDNLRTLFELNENTSCETHDVFKCKRCVYGRMTRSGDMHYGDTSTWNHYSEVDLAKLADPMLRECAKGVVSFVFQYRSHETRSVVFKEEDKEE
jgi:DNA repair and recombination RAD54-like protein